MSENEEEKYDLNESTKRIGQLYPVLVDKKGRVIDGFHRLQADPMWRVQPLDNIDTDEKLLVARCVANWHRRPVGREEKTEWINGLAEIYRKQGLKIKGKSVVLPNGIVTSNEIAVKIMEVTGLAQTTVFNYLDNSWKQEPKTKDEPRTSHIPASERIESELGPKVAERFRKEVLEEAKLSPEELVEKRKKAEEEKKARVEKAKKTREYNKRLQVERIKQLEETMRAGVMRDVRDDIRGELLRDRGFVDEANKLIHSRSIVVEEEPLKKDEGELEKSWDVEDRPVRMMVPDLELIRKRNYLMKAQIIDDCIKRGELSCPKCGGTKLVWNCCGIEIADSKIIAKYREEIKA